MRAAAVQMAVSADRAANLETADRLVGEAVAADARLVVLPELFNLMGSSATLRAGAETLDGPTVMWAAETARREGIWLVAGSFTEATEHGERTHNTSCVLSPEGELAGVYRKIHLFDNEVEGAAYRESATVAPGDALVTVPLEDDLPLGVAVCYDLRFPELFRGLVLAGARIVTLPSAFMARTGVDHWEPLLRARAIENQVFVVAPDQIGEAAPGLPLHGHSMIVDPWGRILAERAEGEGVVVADLDVDAQIDIRRRLPSLDHRRPELYHL